MTNKHYKGNEMIRETGDRCRFRYSQHRTVVLYPIWSRTHTRTSISTKQQRLPFFVANAAFVPRRILLFHHHSCQKDRVPAGYKAYFISGCSKQHSVSLPSQDYWSRGKMFSFSIIFGITFYLSLIISRLCELKLPKYFRSKGRNSRTVIFVGNDPAVSDVQDDDRRSLGRLYSKRILCR